VVSGKRKRFLQALIDLEHDEIRVHYKDFFAETTTFGCREDYLAVLASYITAVLGIPSVPVKRDDGKQRLPGVKVSGNVVRAGCYYQGIIYLKPLVENRKSSVMFLFDSFVHELAHHVLLTYFHDREFHIHYARFYLIMGCLRSAFMGQVGNLRAMLKELEDAGS